MENNDWTVGDLVCMYFGSSPPNCPQTVGLITATGEKEGHWKVMYESEWGTRTAEFPELIFYRPED